MRNDFFAVAGISLLAFSGCVRETQGEFPSIQEAPVVTQVSRQPLSELAPGYGIIIDGSEFEVNIEASDAPFVKAGDPAEVQISAKGEIIRAKVLRIARNVSVETGQAIAWLAPLMKVKPETGEFVFATITTAVKKNALTVPSRAILFKEGKSWVIQESKDEKGKTIYAPVAVETGVTSGKLTEINSGIKDGDRIVIQGGIGFLYPDFKANEAD